METPVSKQRDYYNRTAVDYDALREGEPEHIIASHWLSAIFNYHQYESLLDVGAGTGRIFRLFQIHNPDIQVRGIEPVEGLREQAYAKGISQEQIVDGDGYNLQFEDEAFDVVSAFGVMHHVEYPEKVIAEMLRTSKRAVFISDTNSYAYGSWPLLFLKRAVHILSLWRAFNYVKTGGKMYRYVEEDGIVYAFDIIAAYKQLQRHCTHVYVLTTNPNDWSKQANPFFGSSHLALFGVK